MREMKQDMKEELREAKKRAEEELQFHINKRLAEKFSEPQIRATLTEVAQGRASKIIEEQLNPAINEAKETIDNLKKNLRQDVNDIRTSFDNELKDLRREVDYQKKLRDIQRLQSLVLADCEYKPFETLKQYPSDNEDLKRAARAAINMLKIAHLFPWISVDNPQNINEKFNATAFLKELSETESWESRAKLISSLSYYKRDMSCGIPETLLEVMHSDSSLCVRNNALIIFGLSTDFPYQMEVLEFEKAQKWYDENREQVRKRLKCHAEKQQDSSVKTK